MSLFGSASFSILSIKTDNLRDGNNLETVLELYDAANNLLAENNDCEEPESCITWTPESTGIYYVKIRLYGSRGDCRYDISMTSPVAQTGSLTVSIASSGAVSAEARWSIDSGATWRESGATVADLDPGEYTLEFNDIAGWTKPASQTVTISAGEEKDVTVAYIADITITATDPDASESKINGLFTVTRSGDTSKKLVVNYAVSGSAANGKDYKKLKGKVTIKKNSSTAVITVKPKNDKLAEEDEDVTLTLPNGESATVTIEDND